jgi:hypothetical protein
LFCSRCGDELEAGARYCGACGATSEAERLTGAVNGVVNLAVKLVAWALAFAFVATLLVVVGLGGYAVVGAALICAAWAALRRRG